MCLHLTGLQEHRVLKNCHLIAVYSLAGIFIRVLVSILLPDEAIPPVGIARAPRLLRSLLLQDSKSLSEYSLALSALGPQEDYVPAKRTLTLDSKL